MDTTAAVLERYSEGAQSRQADLCCPVDYDTDLLKALPAEIIERDYGCGDPSRYVQPGDTVLDLGSGGGKICFMAAQITGADGHIIGVDMNDDMLALARQYQQPMQEQFGARIDFVKGNIQDLKLDIEVMAAWLADNPDASELAVADEEDKLRRQAPLIEDNSVSLVLSNCVLNLVDDQQKQQLVEEIYRVTRPGGRIAISDIISDQPIPQSMKDDPELWSGCLSGAFGEKEFLDTFAGVGFANVTYDKWDSQPWKVIDGITFRSATIVATKPQLDKSATAGELIYKGPYQSITTDDGATYLRGERYQLTAEQKSGLLSTMPDDFIDPDGDGDAQPITPGSCCAPDSSCC